MKSVFYTTAMVAAMLVTGPRFVAAQANTDNSQRITERSGAADRANADRANAAGQANAEDPQEMNLEFVNFASNVNQFEQQAGRLAAERATDPQIKQFGQHIADDHQQAQQQLQQAAQAANVQVPSQLNDIHQAMLSHLERKQGRQFDRMFLYEQVAGHTKAVLMFRDAANELQNPQLKQYAEQTLPKLRMHLQEADRIAGTAEAIPAGARLRGNQEGAVNDNTQGQGTDTNAIGNRSNTETSGAKGGGAGANGGAGSVNPRNSTPNDGAAR